MIRETRKFKHAITDIPEAIAVSAMITLILAFIVLTTIGLFL